nr:nucleotidyltransferase family protein [uncultured Halomonas sp.]
MNRSGIMSLLQQHLPAVVRQFDVKEMALFGSMARDETEKGSDIDILVSFDGPATADRYFELQFYLEDLLQRPVDLVTGKAIRSELRPFIEREVVHVSSSMTIPSGVLSS